MRPEPFTHPQSKRTSQQTSLSFKSSKRDLQCCSTESGNSDMETGAKEERTRGMAISASQSCPSQLPFAIPSTLEEITLTIKCLYL